MHFLDRAPLYHTVKPYYMHFFPNADFPRHNFQHSPHQTFIRSMRLCKPQPLLDTHGFEIQHIKTTMSYSDFSEESLITENYLAQIQSHFRDVMGARHVCVLNHEVCLHSAQVLHLHISCQLHNRNCILIIEICLFADQAETASISQLRWTAGSCTSAKFDDTHWYCQRKFAEEC